jgi:hypothetical protein
LLHGRVDGLEVVRGDPCVDVTIEAAEEEEDRDAKSGHGLRQVQRLQLRVHRFERNVVRVKKPGQLPRCDEAFEDAAHHGPEKARPRVEDAAVPIADVLELERLSRRGVRRRPEPLQLREGAAVASFRGFGENELVLALPRRTGRDQWRDRDDRRDLLGMIAPIHQRERAAPRVCEQYELVAFELGAQMVDHGIEIGEVTRDGERPRIGVGIVRATRTALVPVRDDEIVLERVVEVAEERALRAAGPAVDPEDHGRFALRAARQ